MNIRRTLIGLTLFGTPAGLAAQALDYAALQDMFGEPVTTSVTGRPQRASEVPASLTIIPRDEIARSTARNVSDLLKIYAGVDVNRWTAGQSDVAVRGGVQTYNARLLVLVDGRQVYLDHYGETDWNLLGVRIDQIQQIELVRGPASALFGFNAASGVVNIVTVDPTGGPRVTAAVEGGTHGYSRFGGAVDLPLGADVGVRLSGERAREDERRVPTNILHQTDVPTVSADQVGARLTAKPDGRTRIDLDAGWAANEQLEFLPSQALTVQRYRTEHGGLLVDRDVPWGTVSGRVYANWLDADYGVSRMPGLVEPLSLRNRVVVTQLSSVLRLGGNDTLRLGGEARWNDLRSDRLFSAAVRYRNLAGSAALDLHPIDRLALSAAVRVEGLVLHAAGQPVLPAVNRPADFDRTIVSPSFNLGAALTLDESTALRLNGGRGLQSPSLLDFAARIEVPLVTSLPLLIAGDPSLRPAVVWNGEAGLSRDLGTVRTQANVFFTRTQEAIASPGSDTLFQFVALPDPVLVSRLANVGRFDAYGIQLDATGRLGGHLHWGVDYAWTHMTQAIARRYALSPRATTPTHSGTVRLDYERRGWQLAANARVQAATRQYAFGLNQLLTLRSVPLAADVEARIGRVLTRRLTVYVAGENLGDARGAYGSPIPADRRLRVGLRFAS